MLIAGFFLLFQFFVYSSSSSLTYGVKNFCLNMCGKAIARYRRPIRTYIYIAYTISTRWSRGISPNKDSYMKIFAYNDHRTFFNIFFFFPLFPFFATEYLLLIFVTPVSSWAAIMQQVACGSLPFTLGVNALCDLY